MKKIILIGLFLLMMSGSLQAQCVAEIKEVKIDELRGSIIVETEYGLNCEVGKPMSKETCEVYQPEGRNRFLNISGTNASIIDQAERGVDWHCENLIKRIESNVQFIESERVKRLDELKVDRTSEFIINEIKNDLIGYKITKTEAMTSFKGKNIKVTYDSKNTVSNNVITP